MPAASPATRIRIGALKPTEVDEATRIMRLAFGTFLGLPDPLAFADGREFIAARLGAPHVKAFAARQGDRLIGSNLAIRWGSFGFFGPLTVLPEFWDRGVAQQLLQPTLKAFDAWGVQRTGLFTFPHSPKHLSLYQKFGYWPGYLTALMSRPPATPDPSAPTPTLLSTLPRPQRDAAIRSCAQLTNRIDKGLDLSDEIRTMLARKTGDVVLTAGPRTLDGFAICSTGPGSEGGPATCYIKFAAARNSSAPGAAADPGTLARFDRLLSACEAFADARGLGIEVGVNLAREHAFRHLRARRYRIAAQGVSMQRPHQPGFNRADAFVLDDWR